VSSAIVGYGPRRRREVSISDYGYLLDAAERVDAGAVRIPEPAEHARRDVIACVLAVLCCALLGGAIWFAYFAVPAPPV
jgi:hypothetical protein